LFSSLIILVLAAGCTAQKSSSSANVQTNQIARVENSLMRPVAIKGHSMQKMSLISRMRYYHVPSVSIAFFDPSGVIWARGYGAKTDTLFQAGSISKPVSAVGIMRLVQAGRLKLDENVNDALRSWKVPQNALTAKHAVTLRELLSHTAGTNVHGFDGYQRGKPVPTLEQVLDGRPPANSPAIRVDLPPGSQFQYSGGGYIIAQQLLLDTVHEPFAKYMHDAVLQPLGMTNSTFEQPLPRTLWNRAAEAVDPTGKPYPGKWHVYPEQTAAGLWSTPTDLAKFMIGMQHALNGDRGAILSAATAREMLTPVKDHYGLGFGTFGTTPGSIFGHNGANAGFEADMGMHRDGQGVVIMTNSDNGTMLIDEVLNAIGFVYGWRDRQPKQKALYAMAPSTFQRFTGTYEIPDAPPIEVFVKGGVLYAKQALFPLGRLYPESPDTFFVLDEDLDLQFTTGKNGVVNALLVKQMGVTAKKMK
jgi:CubicO group peptidase (beta-lactamase class C family)